MRSLEEALDREAYFVDDVYVPPLWKYYLKEALRSMIVTFRIDVIIMKYFLGIDSYGKSKPYKK